MQGKKLGESEILAIYEDYRSSVYVKVTAKRLGVSTSTVEKYRQEYKGSSRAKSDLPRPHSNVAASYGFMGVMA